MVSPMIAGYIPVLFGLFIPTVGKKHIPLEFHVALIVKPMNIVMENHSYIMENHSYKQSITIWLFDIAGWQIPSANGGF